MFQRDKTGCLQSMANNHPEVLQGLDVKGPAVTYSFVMLG